MNLFIIDKSRCFIFFNIIFLVIAIISAQINIYAQKNLTVLNNSFEQPDSGKIIGFDGKSNNPADDYKLFDIPDWNTTSPDSSNWNSGIEKINTTDGNYAAFLAAHDSSIYQILPRRIYKGDVLKISVDSWSNHINDSLMMELFYVDGDTTNASWIPLISEVISTSNSPLTYSTNALNYDVPEAIGNRIGILFENVSSDSTSMIYIDNVKLDNIDHTIIPLVNFSFELPDSGKINGWNGPGSSSQLSESNFDIPGWASDDKVNDSGIDARGFSDPQEGQYAGYLTGSDTSVYNTTNYMIQGGDELTLRVLAKSVSDTSAILHLELYYINDAGEKATLDFAELVLTTNWLEYTLIGEAGWDLNILDHKLGVLLNNIKPSASKIDVDDVRLNANHNVDVTVVSKTIMKINAFSLEQNYPNPFNPITIIRYSIPQTGFVNLKVFDLLGSEVSTLVDEEKSAGNYKVKFDGSNLASGIYFYRIEAGKYTSVKKLVLIK